MTTIGQGEVKVVRMYVTRNVEQSAEVTIEVKDDDYEALKSGKLEMQKFFDENFEQSTGYDSIGWLETDAGEIEVEAGEVGSFRAEPRKDI